MEFKYIKQFLRLSWFTRLTQSKMEVRLGRKRMTVTGRVEGGGGAGGWRGVEGLGYLYHPITFNEYKILCGKASH